MKRRLFSIARAIPRGVIAFIDWLEYAVVDRPLDRRAARAYADAVEAETGARPSFETVCKRGERYVVVQMAPCARGPERRALSDRIDDRVGKSDEMMVGRVCFDWGRSS